MTPVKILHHLCMFRQSREVATVKVSTLRLGRFMCIVNFKVNCLKSKNRGYNFHPKREKKSNMKKILVFTDQKRKNYKYFNYNIAYYNYM